MKGDNMQVKHVKLNLLDSYWMFYDWLSSDQIKDYNNVNVYRVSSKILNDFMTNQFKITKGFEFCQKPIIFSDSYSCVAITFDNDGCSLLKSSLLLEDELSLNKEIDELKQISIKYEIINQDERCNNLRINQEIKQIIIKEIEQMEKNNEIEKIAYFYYEWFKEVSNDYKIMIKKMKQRINSIISDDEIYIYELIKKCYKPV